MQKIDLNKKWAFYESNESMSFVFGMPDSQIVDLPHDFIISKPRSASAAGGPANGYFGEGEGVYHKILEDVDQWKDKIVILDVDGAYMNMEVALNGQLLAIHPYGYTPYQVDLTNALRFDGRDNKLKIITQSRQPSTRWYSGGGLYRSVCLWIGNKTYVNPWDIFVTTPEVSKDRACVNFDVTLTNTQKDEKNYTLTCSVMDANGHAVACAFKEVVAGAGQTRENLRMDIANPNLWDIDQPYLYTYKVTVSDGSEMVDENTDTFGIRTIAFSVENGFQLNGKTVKMKGGCIHHDNGLLGACAYPKAEERKIKILKSVGYNAVRISHYPPSMSMLKACDRLGMLLLDECFDVWRMGKMPMDYHLYFEDWWERDIEYMVKRDRNHPCVITYSVGNEIGERDGSGNGAKWSKLLHDKFKSLDPTRCTLSAICGIFDEDMAMGTNFDANAASGENDNWAVKTKDFAAPLDIVGYNYLYARYGHDHELFPERIIIGTETHALTTYDFWQETLKYPYVCGDFIWAAVDYLGEVGVGKTYWANDQEPFNFMGEYPWRTSWQSDILLTGKRRPQSYFREILWGHTDATYLFTTHPKHFGETCSGTDWRWHDVNDSWTFDTSWIGKMVRVDAYGCGDEAEFILNGHSLGRVPYEKLIATMDVPYEMGVIEAVTYKAGKEISRGRLVTAGTPAKIVLIPEETTLVGDGEDLCYVHIEIQDEKGICIPDDERELKVILDGPATLLTIGSGSPYTEDGIGTDVCHAYDGAAVVIFKAGGTGTIKVRVAATDLPEAQCEVTACEREVQK